MVSGQLHSASGLTTHHPPEIDDSDHVVIFQECACICAFVSAGHIAAVCLDGSFHKYHFSADGIINQVNITLEVICHMSDIMFLKAKYDVITELCEDCDWLAMRNQ